MTLPSDIFRRRGTMGWLALGEHPLDLGAGGGTLSERILALADLACAPNALVMGAQIPGEAHSLLSDLEILLGAEPQVLDVRAMPVAQMQEAWLQAGLILLLGGEPREWREWIGEQLFCGTPPEVIAEDSLLIALGPAAATMGTWWYERREERLARGLGWLMGAIVILGEDDPGTIEPVLERLETQEGLYAVGLRPGALLALGPEGEVETWGDQAPILLLGRGWETA